MENINDDDWEREAALAYQKVTGDVYYLFDDSGNEYWYSASDTRKHYTREEG